MKNLSSGRQRRLSSPAFTLALSPRLVALIPELIFDFLAHPSSLGVPLLDLVAGLLGLLTVSLPRMLALELVVLRLLGRRTLALSGLGPLLALVADVITPGRLRPGWLLSTLRGSPLIALPTLGRLGPLGSLLGAGPILLGLVYRTLWLLAVLASSFGRDLFALGTRLAALLIAWWIARGPLGLGTIPRVASLFLALRRLALIAPAIRRGVATAFASFAFASLVVSIRHEHRNAWL